jgi:hypothetical protein
MNIGIVVATGWENAAEKPAYGDWSNLEKPFTSLSFDV